MTRTFRAPVTRIADEHHLEYLLSEAENALQVKNPALAIVHLSQAVLVAVNKGTALDELELTRRVKGIIESGGVVA